MDSDTFFRLSARHSDMEVLRVKGNLTLIEKLNLPAIMAFKLPGRPDRGYLTLREIIDQDVILTSGDNTLIVAGPDSLGTYYTNSAYIFWKNFRALEGTIPLTSSGGTIMGLKMLLKEIGFDGIRIDTRYDSKTREAVRSVQFRHGLKTDGYVGPLTKIILYNENQNLPIPHLTREG